MLFEESRADRRKRAGIKPALNPAAIPPAKPYTLLTRDEILSGVNRTLILDTESYPNYFLAAFQCLETGKVVYFEDSPDATVDTDLLSFVLHRFLTVGFNSIPYDLPMLLAAIKGSRAPALKQLSDKMIVEGERLTGNLPKAMNHIDLFDVAPLPDISLKLYAGRMHAPRMQDLPYAPDKLLTPEEARNVRDYCINDLDNTSLLFKAVLPQIELREALGKDYGQDLRSRSDAQVAEAVILGELAKLGVRPRQPTVEAGRRFRISPPPGLSFQTPALQHVLSVTLSTDFVIGLNGAVNTPAELTGLDISINGKSYKMGNGGLHSNEKSLTSYSTDTVKLIDRDVASYYPAILINQRLYPHHLGEAFIDVYTAIRDRRLRAKSLGLKTEAEGLKIAVNGGIGKLSNQYSKLYAPEVNSQVTVSGQLYLLMLIEAVELAGIPVISANTDGIVMAVPNDKKEALDVVIKWWEHSTGFVTEETVYRSLHCRDVNNYIAIKPDGGCKLKGVYSEVGSALNSVLSKNPESLIVSDAIQAFLSSGKPVADTIFACTDIRRFVNVRTVRGGARKDTTYLGKVIRWYYSTEVEGTINYVISGNSVPKTERARPAMILPTELPPDLNFNHYIREAEEALMDLGAKVRPGQRKLL